MPAQLHRELSLARQMSTRSGRRAVVVVGNFDGVHTGHQQLLARAVQDAGEAHRVVVLTFWPHPARFFRPQHAAFELMTLEQRARHLGEHGVHEVLAMPFDERASRLSPEEFVDEVLVETLHATEVIVGEDFHFGHRRSGDTHTLRELGQAKGFTVVVHEPVLDGGGEVISSTRIREHVRAGELERAQELLGRPHELTGEVVHGDARGRQLGFPTANVAAEQEVFLPDGIYTTTLHTGRYGTLTACTYIGTRPTYEEALGRNVETFVLDVPQSEEGFDLYGEHVTIALHHFQRPDMAFEGSEALVVQMERDVAMARAWHEKK